MKFIWLEKAKKDESGMMLAAILMISIFLSVLAFAIINLSTVNLSRSRSRVLLLQAQYASESGADAALATLNSGNTTYTGTASDVQILDNSPYYKATYSVSVTAGSNDKERYITATGKVYAPASASTPKYSRRIEVFTQRSSTTTAASIVGRNILYIESGVKNIQARDLYINGYIVMNKNTTNLIAENITVGGRAAGAGNCSISGTGNLIKPSSFTTVGQTKTNLTLAYNNCISPPGNTSNANFNVLPNQSNISTIQSTFIPWGQYMDSSYTSGNCSDWTTGSFPRNIPSLNGSKKTHYPNSSSGVDASGACGTSGNLVLGSGQYNINDNAHIRANLCGTTGCDPIFYNPDNGVGANPLKVKYVFVEGTINFSSLNTAANSGPIVFISYGADPAGLAGSCPYGGSIFLGSSDRTNAPQVYLLALNGLCISKTKFNSSSALGGLSAKNIYIDSSPATPFDLKMNDSYPTDQIPIDLSWKSVRYRRL
jgi:hypothetical protein